MEAGRAGAEVGGRKQSRHVVITAWLRVMALEMERRLLVGWDGNRNCLFMLWLTHRKTAQRSPFQMGCQVPELTFCLSSTSASTSCVGGMLSLERLQNFSASGGEENRRSISLLLG